MKYTTMVFSFYGLWFPSESDKLIRQSMLVSVLAEAIIHNESGVKAIPLDVPENEMTGCVHTLKDSYHKRSMQEFIRMLGESIAVKASQNDWI